MDHHDSNAMHDVVLAPWSDEFPTQGQGTGANGCQPS